MHCPLSSNARVRNGSRRASLALVFAATLASLGVPAHAQQSRRAAPGAVIIPDSSRVIAGDAGLRAHTNVRLTLPASPSPAEAPPAPGYAYETPASLACIYRVVGPIKACNPNSTMNTPNGGSESIAIVDAFDDPGAASDLAAFSSQFGLPYNAAKFKVVYASGKQPATDPSGGWEFEESADIEYAHAMAPNATLYLVEAPTNSFADLFNAVYVASHLVRCGHVYACPANATGHGEVSMSWGGGEFSSETSYDSVFTGAGAVYLAATGDAPGVIYPSASPNVIAVGGTSTARSLMNGDLIQEIAWSDAGGGLSQVETTPSYQLGLPTDITQGARALPDVAADANLDTGVWVYDSFPLAGSQPSVWWIGGGTSISTPVMAGIINAASTASKHWAASTKAELTEMYMDYPNTSAYHSDFWDITYGACNYYMSSRAVGGYDLCTGLGSPKGLMGK